MPELQPISKGEKNEAPPGFFPEVEKFQEEFSKKEAQEPVSEKDLLAGLSFDEKRLAQEYYKDYPEIGFILADAAKKKVFLKELSIINKLPEGMQESSLLNLFNKNEIISAELRHQAEAKDRTNSQKEMEDIWGSIKEREFRSQDAPKWESKTPPLMSQ